MNQYVCAGAILQCPFGNVPTPLNVLPTNKVNTLTPLATEMDHIPLVNIIPFGMCSNPANPMVAAATAAALGVLTPMPCIPVTTTPWEDPKGNVKIAGNKAITNQSTLMCMYGGKIQIKFAGQIQVIG